MSAPCFYTYNGKKYSFSEFSKYLHDGELAKLEKDNVIDLSKKGAPPIKPPKEEKTYSADEIKEISNRHATFDAIAEELGLPTYEKGDVFETESQIQEANKRLAKGEFADLIKKLERKDMPSAVEQKMLAIEVDRLKKEYDKNKSDKTLNEIEKIMDLSNEIGGRDVARSLQARAVRNPKTLEGGLATAMIAKKTANGTDVLTDAQKAEVEAQVEKYKKLAEEATAARLKVEEAYSKMLAEKELENVKKDAAKNKSKAPKTKEDYKKEREVIVADIRAKLKASRSQANDVVTALVDFAKIAPDVAKLVKSLVDETIDITLPELIKKAHGILSEDIPEITEKDISDVIAGKYKKNKPTRSELSAKMFELQQEQKLLNELDRVMAKKPRNESQERVKNKKLTELRNKINQIKKEEGLDQYSDEAKVKALIKRNIETAKKIRERIEKGDFEKAEKPKSWIDNQEFKEKYPDLYEKAIDTQIDKNDAQLEFDIALAKDKMQKENAGQKLVRNVRKGVNTLQQLVAGVDDSLALVQLAWTLPINPKIALNFRKVKDANGKTTYKLGGALTEHALDAASKKRFDREMAALHNSEYWPLIQKSGLDVLEPKSLVGEMHEEMFQNSFASDIGTKKVNLGKFLSIWERAYTSLGNNTRVALFLKEAEIMYSKGMTIENSLEEFKGIARMINNQTGRGSMTPAAKKAMPYVSPIIWSPKMMASSLNILGVSDLAFALVGKKGYYASLPKYARERAITETARGLSLSILTLAAAAAAGYVIHPDPRDPKFGDIEYGEDNNKSINVFLRYAGYIKLLAQMFPGFLGGGIKTKEKVVEVGDVGGKTRAEIGGKFLRGKFNPVSGFAYDYFLNDQTSSFDKKPLTLTKAAEDLTVPMSLRQVRKNLEEDGTLSLLTDFLPNFVGLPMKDQRDFYGKEGFDKDVNKFLSKNRIKVGEVKTITIDDEEHPDKKPTEKEEKEVRKLHDEYVNKALKEAIETDYLKEYVDGKLEDMSQERIGEEVRWIHSKALQKAKEKVFGKKMKDPSQMIESKIKNMKRDLFEGRVFGLSIPN